MDRPAGETGDAVKVFVDIPNYFWKSDDPDRADVRTTYVSLFAALSRLGCEIVARPFRPYSDTLHRPDPAEGLHYAYHAREPGPGAYCIKGAALPDLWYLDPRGYSGGRGARQLPAPLSNRESVSLRPARSSRGDVRGTVRGLLPLAGQ